MSDHQPIQLGVNVDHVATLRQARGVSYPDPLQAADIARLGGADSVTVHLREDRRHIQDHDVYRIRQQVKLPMNLEMAATTEMLEIALQVAPAECCLVPEKRAELTTEGGLDVVAQQAVLVEFIGELRAAGIRVSLFIDPDAAQIEASHAIGADIVELHTGCYAECGIEPPEQLTIEFNRLRDGARVAHALGLQVNAGHGLHYQNVAAIAALPEIVCLNIGHSIVSRAVLTGFHEAVFTMKKEMIDARLTAEALSASE
ncbi:MAG: pyridoxine 5'-phosphate synthase [Gammaproteobacteria bacterium]|nr:pyridoxine 5'-phosphate synthase [Gammaproteobacteria bacterium]